VYGRIAPAGSPAGSCFGKVWPIGLPSSAPAADDPAPAVG
jgi:hypothetical protein